MLIVIPARGGSTRIPKKNIYKICDKPLIEFTFDQLNVIKHKYPVYLSSDDKEILKFSSKFEKINILERPQHLATNISTTESALIHCIEQINCDVLPEWIMTLPPTSPFRKSSTIQSFIDMSMLVDKSIDCIMSVSKNYGDFWCYRDSELRRLFPDSPRRQQDREPLLEENSAIYITRTKTLIENKSILGTRVFAQEIPLIEALDINNMSDIFMAEAILAKQNKHEI